MMLIIGLFMIIPIIIIIKRLENIKIKKIEKILLNLFMILISILFIIICFIVNEEPFVFDIKDSFDYIIYTAALYLFTPFLWIITIYYIKKLITLLKVKKNSIIKNNKDYIYYRDDLDKISPNVIMFTSEYNVDIKRSVSSVILKLKINGFIEEKNKTFKCINKDESNLLESEKQVLALVKTGKFDNKLYINTIEKETLKGNYVKKRKKGFIWALIKIIITIFTLVMSFNLSQKLDKYVFKNYHIITEKSDGYKYIVLRNEKDIEKLYSEVKNHNDYYGREIIMPNGTHKISYNYNQIRANKYHYSVVRKSLLLNFLVTSSILLCIMGVVITIYIVIYELINMNKSYKRTVKGKNLLNKAYALKNFLKETCIDKRKEKEVLLWEYYLVYATILDVNEQVQDEIIQKYLK